MSQQTNIAKFTSVVNSTCSNLSFIVPFKNGEHRFKVMSVAQHQKLIANTNKSYKEMKEFRKVLFSIMKENTLDGIANLTGLDQTDFYLFLYWNRYYSLSKNFNNIEMVFNPEFKRFEEDLNVSFENFKLECSMPTIETVLWAESQFKESDEESEGKLIVGIYTSELLKYINVVHVGDDFVNLTGATYEERQKLLGVLPAQLIRQLSEKLTKYSQYIDDNFFFTIGEERISLPTNVDFYSV